MDEMVDPHGGRGDGCYRCVHMLAAWAIPFAALNTTHMRAAVGGGDFCHPRRSSTCGSALASQ